MATYTKQTDAPSIRTLIPADIFGTMVKDILGDEKRKADAKSMMEEAGERQKHLGYAEMMMRSNPDVTNKSARNFNKIVAEINEEWKGEEKPVMIKIVPLGLIAQCHTTSQLAMRHLPAEVWEWRSGYNITNCPCGHQQVAELHSVLYHKPTNTYHDLTKDFDGLTEKLFLPIRKMDVDKEFFIHMVKRRYAEFIVMGLDHRCILGRFRSYGGEHDANVMSERRAEIAVVLDLLANPKKCRELPRREMSMTQWFQDMASSGITVYC